MPAPMTQPQREAFLAEPHIATVCVDRLDGRPPLATPSMYAYQPGGDVTFFTGTRGRPRSAARACPCRRPTRLIDYVLHSLTATNCPSRSTYTRTGANGQRRSALK